MKDALLELLEKEEDPRKRKRIIEMLKDIDEGRYAFINANLDGIKMEGDSEALFALSLACLQEVCEEYIKHGITVKDVFGLLDNSISALKENIKENYD